MKIYRVEHLEIKQNLSDDFGVGPYINPLRFTKWQDDKKRHESRGERPSPQNDKKLKKYFHSKCFSSFMKEKTTNEFDKNFISGFKSLNQLKQWFSQTEIQKLSERGFVVKEYNNFKKVIVGDKSLMFIPNKPGKVIKIK